MLGASDLAILVGAVYAGHFLRWANISEFRDQLVAFLPEAVTFTSVFWLTMFAVGLYQRDSSRDARQVITRLIGGFALGFLLLSMVIYLFPQLNIWRSAVAIAMVIAFVGMLAARRLFLHLTDIDRFKRRVLVLGAGKWASRIQKLCQQRPSVGFLLHGFVPYSADQRGVEEKLIVELPGALADYARAQAIDEVVVAIQERRGSLPLKDLMACKLAGIRVIDYSTFWEKETGEVDIDALQPSWIIFSDGFVGGWMQSVVKRTFDLVASLLFLALTFPVMVFVAVAIKLESRGPVFYRQERVGLHGVPFMLLKFRSMHRDAERSDQPRWTEQNDPRITRVGAWIRRTRVDETPQILNVLKGDMSLVGPRPERPYFVEDLAEQIPFYKERHEVKPGITGWAQLNSPYAASVDEAKQKLQYDLYYIKNYSIFLDIIVLMQTVRVVLWPEGVR